MNDKYYTPTIDEFHIGFEYLLEEEFLDEEGYAYYEEKEKIFSIGDTITFNRYERVNGYALYHIKVKYLDKEDIESLGFKQNKKDSNIFDSKDDKYWIMRDSSGKISIDSEENECNFYGYIKNKSELKKILNQLNIEIN